jgi:hypothetical protein
VTVQMADSDVTPVQSSAAQTTFSGQSQINRSTSKVRIEGQS